MVKEIKCKNRLQYVIRMSYYKQSQINEILELILTSQKEIYLIELEGK